MAKKTKETVAPTPTEISKAEKIAHLKALQASVAWGMILEVLRENKEYLERAILDGIDPETGEKLSPEEQDDARRKRGLTQDLMETPAGLIESISNATEGEDINFDPYHDDALELAKDTL